MNPLLPHTPDHIQWIHDSYLMSKVSVFASVCPYICTYLTNFQSNPYLSCFKLEIEAEKDKLSLLI